MTTTKKQTHTKWTTELIDEYLKENYPWVHLIPGQKYTTNKSKYWFYCHTHGAYETQWSRVHTKSGPNQG